MPQPHPYTKQDDAAPFLDLISDAEEVQIREVSASNRQRILSTLDRFTQEVTGGREADRIFFVHLKERDSRKAQPAPTNIPKDTAYLLNNGLLLLESNELVLARNVFSYILKQELKNPVALIGLGRCLMGLGQSTSARKCFRATWEWSQAEEALYWLAQCYLKDGLDELAEKYLNRIENPDALPRSIQFGLYKDRGNCHLRANKLEAAEKDYEHALQIEPNSHIIQVNLGTLAFQGGDYQGAIEQFEKVLRDEPTHSKALCGLGMVHNQNGEKEKAWDAFSKAIHSEPLNTVAIFHLYEIADQRGALGEVEELMKTFIEKSPKNNDVRYALATIQYRQGKWATCESNLNTVLTQDPKHTKASKLLGELVSNRHRK